jgi:DNA polymerase III subunit delta'
MSIRVRNIPAQSGPQRLLNAALHEGAAHAYLLYGPAGVGKRAAAFGFAGAILGDARRVEAGTHPDLQVIEPLGEMIRIDEIRALHHDLHMRPFEADRRVYLILDADRLNADAADALLKDLEEPPAYATIVLVADTLGPIPETIRSRCQLIPFHRLPERVVREWVVAQEPSLAEERVRVVARVAAGRLDRAQRLLDPDARDRRDGLIAAARSVYLAEAFDTSEGVAVVLDSARAFGAAAGTSEQEIVDTLDLTTREADQRVKRAQRGAEREETLASLEELEAWYRDLIVCGAGADASVANADRLIDLRADAEKVGRGAEDAAELVREAWRVAEEFNVNPQLWLEALFVRLRRAFSGAGVRSV